MESVKQALHEADNWSILAADFETVTIFVILFDANLVFAIFMLHVVSFQHFDSGNIEKITSVLVNMQQSLNVLSNADDYEDKKMELEGLKNRLEANVSPHIVKAFTTSNFGNSFRKLIIYFVPLLL